MYAQPSHLPNYCQVLEAGFNVLFADLDAIFLKSPAPILADGDFIGGE